ncbi:hypothetical protein SO579_001099 [Escherichia coli]|nr:hypothetical protein [Escherichia coli]ELY9179045.1 hypothetical protein [Escherichia coli]
MPKLVTWMNNQRVGELTKLANGAHTFKYAAEWLLPTDFPENVVTAVETNVLRLHDRLSREYGIK